MADPGCATCRYFRPAMFQSDDNPEFHRGECMDESKRIYPRRGVPSDMTAPDVYGYQTCDNWTDQEGRTKHGPPTFMGLPIKEAAEILAKHKLLSEQGRIGNGE